MQVLSASEIAFVSGGIQKVSAAKLAKRDPSPSPSLDRPTPGESEVGRQINDAAAALNAFGGWLGRSLYDLLH